MPPWSLVLVTVVGSGPNLTPAHEAPVADAPAAAAAPAALGSTELVSTAPLSFVFDPGATQDPESALPAAEGTDPPAPGRAPLVPLFGTQGSSRWFVQFGRGAEVDETENAMSVLGVGYSYFIGRAISLDFEVDGTSHSQIGEDAAGVNLNLLFRWHCVVERGWTFYLDAGAGVQYTNEDVPRLGSKFNWTPQAGLGVSFDVGRDIRLLLGCRWHHQSNANLFDTNPGRDSILGYVQLNFPF